MTNTVGPMIKKARAGAGLTQEQLAMKVTGLSASDISRAERGELIPTQEQLKTIAKVTGVTQKSLLDAEQFVGYIRFNRQWQETGKQHKRQETGRQHEYRHEHR